MEDVRDPVVRVPEVADLSGHRGVVGPIDADLAELLAHRLEREARVALREVPLVVLDEDEDVVADRVAPPALVRLLALDARLDVLGVVDHAARLAGDEVVVVPVARSGRRGEEVVGERVFPGPHPVVRDLRLVELRVRVGRAVDAGAEPVELPAVHAVQVGRPVVREVAGQPVRAGDQRLLVPVLDADGGAGRSGERPEEIVEAPVLEHHVDHALDRRVRVDRRGRVVHRGDRLPPRAGEEDAAGHGHRRGLQEPAAAQRQRMRVAPFLVVGVWSVGHAPPVLSIVVTNA